MSEKQRSRGTFHARMHEVEKGLFQAEYSGEINPTSTDARDIPDAHVGTSVADVKTWVEQMALNLSRLPNVLRQRPEPELAGRHARLSACLRWCQVEHPLARALGQVID
jgi:hypothetical protein